MIPFKDTIHTQEGLRALYDQPRRRVLDKEVDALDAVCRAFIAATPLVMVATSSAEGLGDCSPRGGAPGFVHVVDERRLLLPDDRGNNRIDTLRNIVATGQVGLLLLVPGRRETLRINGRAWITTDPQLLAAARVAGKVAPAGIGVEIRTAFLHCGKALIRSHLWEPERWPDLDAVPTREEITMAHIGGTTLEEELAATRESNTQRLTW
jgi:PPOX class probable FMN-dependent enzyme